MDKYDKFRIICKTKLSKIVDEIGQRNIVLWGASKGGEIAKEELEKLGKKIEKFVDRDYANKKEFLGTRVEAVETIRPEYDYLVIAVMSFKYEFEDYIWEKGFTDKDYIYMTMRGITRRI